MLSRLTALGLVAALNLAGVLSASAEDSRPQKKLIEWGWDEPDARFMLENVEKMEQLPFDGVVFHVVSSKGGTLVWEMWGKREFALAEFQPSIEDLKATRFRRLTDRFLRVNVTPGDVDWFDDRAWAVVLNNFSVAARIAKQGGCKGFMFDVEQYNAELFNYGKQVHREAKPFDAYRAQVRRRGQQWMKAVGGPFPDITLLLAYAYSITGGQPQDRAKASYGLLGDFLDGMLDACTPATRFIDGWEGAYRYRQADQFQRAYEAIRVKLPSLAADPEKYRRHFSAGFGIWMDADWRSVGWRTDDLSKNFFTPAEFEASVRLGLERTDEYVWIYTEQPRWWTMAKLPPQYVEGLRKARGR